MKPAPLILAGALAALPGFAADAPSAIPANFPAERYEALIARSPFTLATPPAAPAPPPDKGFAEGWYLTSLARVDGMDFVTIKARDGGVQFSLFGPEPKDGVSLQKVDWSDSVGRSTVTVAKDGQVAKLEFNQAEISAAPQAPASPTPQSMIRAPGQGGNMPHQPAVPRPLPPVVQPQGLGAKPPVVSNPMQNPGIPRPSGNGLSGTAILPNTGPVPANNGGDGRRRIRVIQNNMGQ